MLLYTAYSNKLASADLFQIFSSLPGRHLGFVEQFVYVVLRILRDSMTLEPLSSSCFQTLALGAALPRRNTSQEAVCDCVCVHRCAIV